MLKVLDVEGAVARDGTRWPRVAGAATGSTTPSATRASPRCAAASRRRWPRFGADGRCLMRALQEELDDPDAGATAGAARSAPARASTRRSIRALVREAALHLRSRPLVLERQEDGAGRRRARCARSPRTCAPRRAARWRGSATAGGTRLVAGRPREGRLRRRARRGGGGARARRGARRSAWVTAVPSRRPGDLVPDFARAARRRARAARSRDALERVGDRPPQREMANAAQQVANVRGAFAVAGDLPPGPACSSTTSASAAGRWRWSPASCAAGRGGGVSAGPEQAF